MRVAISGGAGFLGLHLARRLRTEGAEVRTLDVAALDDPVLELQKTRALRAVLLEKFSDAAIAEGPRTADLGGSATTAEVERFLLERIGAAVGSAA